MEFNSYIKYLKPNLYNKIKSIHLPFLKKKSFFILLDGIFGPIVLNVHYLTEANTGSKSNYK